MTKLPTLYSRTSNGQIQVWEITIDGNSFFTTEGLQNGKMTNSTPTICEGKNTGRSNETSGEAQAAKEAQAKWDKKKKQHYFEDIKDIDQTNFIEPMLCKKWYERKDKIDLSKGVFVQPKLDGCLSGDSIIEFENGKLLTIKEIVENKINGNVKSFNVITNEIEYQPIENWSKNGIDITETNNQWFLIETENGQQLKLTGNHMIWLPLLNCWRRVDQLIIGDIVLSDKT